MSIKSPQALNPIQETIHQKYRIPVYTGEFWTAKQRQMHPIHYTISYRASFKPELPNYFMKRFLKESGKTVLDPFGGRGTTTLQANLLGNYAIHNDRNPVSLYLIQARQNIPELHFLKKCIDELPIQTGSKPIKKSYDKRLLPFFHTRTLSEIYQLRELILADPDMNNKALHYIGLIALSRLHGHSDGFLSVYSFPQISIMPQAQARNNKNRGIKPEYRSIQERIWKKAKSDLSRPLPDYYHNVSMKNCYYKEDARNLVSVKSSSVDLIITSPPFLNKVNYFEDNWMRAWFLALEKSFQKEDLTNTSSLDEWKNFMKDVILEMGRVLKPGGISVIEVGEIVIKRQMIHLEDEMLDCLPVEVPGGQLVAREILINSQSFTKLANCWDIKNNKKGTNTNRCLVLEKV